VEVVITESVVVVDLRDTDHFFVINIGFSIWSGFSSTPFMVVFELTAESDITVFIISAGFIVTSSNTNSADAVLSEAFVIVSAGLSSDFVD
jgi:hypothetical protein